MLKIAITKDGQPQEFTLPAALEAAIQSVVTEPGSGYQDAADVVMAALSVNCFSQAIRRYPPASVTTKAQQIETLRTEQQAIIDAVLKDPAIKTKSVPAADTAGSKG